MKDVVTDLKVSVFQICSDDSFKNNSKKILELLRAHNLKLVDLCVFPENALYISISKKSKVPKISLKQGFFKKIQELAKKNDVVIHLGSVLIYREKKCYNTSLVVNSKGEIKEVYDKIHLFTAKIGSLDIDEGSLYFSGNTPKIIRVKGWKIGLSICFDLRFSELYSFYAKNHCDMILVPSAFFRKTGKVHWQTLLKARAIESQCYVVAPGQVGVHESIDEKSIRKSYGHSLVIHPWGDVLADLGEKIECVQTVVLDKKEIKKVKNSIVMKRRL